MPLSFKENQSDSGKAKTSRDNSRPLHTELLKSLKDETVQRVLEKNKSSEEYYENSNILNERNVVTSYFVRIISRIDLFVGNVFVNIC